MHLYLVNGFLGSGKTTAIANACIHLVNHGKAVAVITNDQGNHQVDSAYIKSLSLQGGEVSNGCFCCRYDEFEQTVAAFDNAEKPDIIFAESVGSCTDLVATVVKPFIKSKYHPRIVISVFADAYLMYSIMTGSSFFIEEAVRYIYRKQLEEADIIVINKTDLLNAEELTYIDKLVKEGYPGKKVFYMNAFNKNDISGWLLLLSTFNVPSQRKSLEVDYDTYGAGEAMLAWLDQRVSVHASRPVAMNAALILAETIYERITKAGYTIGHLKFFLSDGDWHQKISYTTTGIRKHFVPEMHQCNHLKMLINARVQTSPKILRHITELAIEHTMTATGCRILSHQVSSFQPGYPRPLHRIAD